MGLAQGLFATLGRVPLAGGAPREVLENVAWADWSPDGAEPRRGAPRRRRRSPGVPDREDALREQGANHSRPGVTPGRLGRLRRPRGSNPGLLRGLRRRCRPDGRYEDALDRLGRPVRPRLAARRTGSLVHRREGRRVQGSPRGDPRGRRAARLEGDGTARPRGRLAQRERARGPPQLSLRHGRAGPRRIEGARAHLAGDVAGGGPFEGRLPGPLHGAPGGRGRGWLDVPAPDRRVARGSPRRRSWPRPSLRTASGPCPSSRHRPD